MAQWDDAKLSNDKFAYKDMGFSGKMYLDTWYEGTNVGSVVVPATYGSEMVYIVGMVKMPDGRLIVAFRDQDFYMIKLSDQKCVASIHDSQNSTIFTFKDLQWNSDTFLLTFNGSVSSKQLSFSKMCMAASVMIELLFT